MSSSCTKNILCYALWVIYVIMTAKTFAESHSVSGNNIRCNDNTTEDCTITCDEEQAGVAGYFDCGNKASCYIRCDEENCLQDAIINASNTNNLHLHQGEDASQCLNGATIYTPNHGNATFTMNSDTNKPFKATTIHSGTNTQNIIIDASRLSGDIHTGSFADFTINANSAQYVRFELGSGDWMNGRIYCPVYPLDHSYNGPQISSCMIDATRARIDNVAIYAPAGIPEGVWVSDIANVNGMNQIHCDNGISTAPFSEGSDCWPTLHPTTNPSEGSITVPTNAPTNVPTKNPTNNPTSKPTPTMRETKSPTRRTANPSLTPTMNPIQAPTLDPTSPPTLDPTTKPSLSPTTATHTTTKPTRKKRVSQNPTLNPSKAPTVDPTAKPSQYPTAVPTQVPSWNRIPDLTIHSTESNLSTDDPESTIIDSTTQPTSRSTISPTVSPSPNVWELEEIFHESKTTATIIQEQSKQQDPFLSIAVMIGICVIICMVLSLAYTKRIFDRKRLITRIIVQNAKANSHRLESHASTMNTIELEHRPSNSIHSVIQPIDVMLTPGHHEDGSPVIFRDDASSPVTFAGKSTPGSQISHRLRFASLDIPIPYRHDNAQSVDGEVSVAGSTPIPLFQEGVTNVDRISFDIVAVRRLGHSDRVLPLRNDHDTPQ